MDVWGMHKTQKYWKFNANEFNSENFAEENIIPKHSYAFLPFGGGPHKCIGIKQFSSSTFQRANVFECEMQTRSTFVILIELLLMCKSFSLKAFTSTSSKYFSYINNQLHSTGQRYAHIVTRVLVVYAVKHFRFSTAIKIEDIKFKMSVTLQILNENVLNIERRPHRTVQT